MKPILLSILTMFFVGCQRESHPPVSSHPEKELIRQGLQEVITQPANAFLIVENPETSDYIQFAYEGGAILIDLPEMALDPDQIEKAKVYFEDRSIPMKVSTSEDPASGEVFTVRSWTTSYPVEDVDQVVDIALGAMIKIYGVSETTPLVIIKGWE